MLNDYISNMFSTKLYSYRQICPAIYKYNFVYLINTLAQLTKENSVKTASQALG